MENIIETHYLKILEAFNTSTLKEIEEKFGNKYLFKIAMIVFFILLILIYLSASMFEFNNQDKVEIAYVASKLIVISVGFVIFGLIFIYSRDINNKVISTFGKNSEYFINQNKVYWRGIRALMFFEKLQKENIDLNAEEITNILNKELELKKFEILKNPFFMGVLTVSGMMANSIFDKLSLEWLFVCLLISLLVIYFFHGLISILRTEESKINDLKLFIHWYELFGKDLIERKEIVK